MTPYQFFRVTDFPDLKPGDEVNSPRQIDLFGGVSEDIQTSFRYQSDHFEGDLGLLRVSSEIKHSTFGFIKRVVDEKRQKLNFTEYLEPVDFPAYIDHRRGVVAFQASKKVCRGIVVNLKASNCGFQIAEMRVDFEKLVLQCEEYLGAWFKGISSRVRNAGLSGDQIQDDQLFKRLMKLGKLSNVTIPWMFEGAEHQVMVTGNAAVVLVRDYRNNLAGELRVAFDVFDRLVSHVWCEKPARRGGGDDD